MKKVLCTEKGTGLFVIIRAEVVKKFHTIRGDFLKCKIARRGNE